MRGLMALRNLDGLVVTVPYKHRATELADLLHPTGRRVGAINALRRERDGRWSGDMFDGQGLVRALRARDVRLSGARVRMLGAGGAGSAVAVALADAGVAEIAIFDVATDRAASLAEQLRRYYPSCDCRATIGPVSTDNADLLINCTPIGMAPGEGMPVPLGPLDPALMVVDVIMKPEVTPLLAHAASCGCRTMNGRPMLEGQAQAVVEFFLQMDEVHEREELPVGG
jgi:shikimate dehydrogenase